jgi:peptide/nickel transport system permease protein
VSEVRRLVLRRGRNAVITIFGIMTLNFFLINFMGDPTELLAPRDPKIPDEYVQTNCIRYGLCGPDGKPLTVPERFWLYIQNTLTGNWGVSYYWKGASVLNIVMPALGWTIILIGTSTVITILLGMALGALSAQRRGRAFDIATMGFSLFFYGMPFFWLALVMQLSFREPQFGLNWWPVLPTSQEYDVGIIGFTWANFDHVLSVLHHLILPATTLALGTVAGVSLVMRNSLIDVMTEDYVVTARAKGLAERMILRRHVLPNGLPPMVTLIALDMAFIFGGAYQVEYVFSYEGIGYVTITAITQFDFPVIQFVVVLGGLAVVIANFFADLILLRIDPRIKVT